MARLHFRCPVTGEEIDVGIESELGTLLRIRRSLGRAERDRGRLFLPRREDVQRRTFESKGTYGGASLVAVRHQGARHQSAQQPQRGGAHQRSRSVHSRENHRPHAGSRRPARVHRLGSGEPVSDRPLIGAIFAPSAPATKRSRREQMRRRCFLRSCRAGPPAPCPHTARHSPGRFGPARPGYFFVWGGGTAGGSPTGSLRGALRWRVCISAVRSRAKRSTSASKANWGRCCGFDEARFVPVIRCAAGSTIGASATLGSAKRHELTAGSFLTRMACRKRGFFPTGGSRALACMLRPGPRYATEPMPAARIGVCRRRSIGGARQGGAPGLRRAAADAAIAVCGTKGGSRRCSRTRW